MKRAAMKKRYYYTGPSAETVALVIRRDRGRCAVCGEEIDGERGRDWSVQHRLRRGDGGTRRAFVNLPGNLVLAHGSGTTSCHGLIERMPAWAREFGYRVDDGVVLPTSTVIAHAVHGRVLLADDGTWEAA